MPTGTWDELYEAYKGAKPEDAEKALEDPEDAERFNTQADADFCMLMANCLTIFTVERTMGGGSPIRLKNLDECKEDFNSFKDSDSNKLPNGKLALDMLMDEVNSLKDNPSKTTEEMMESMFTTEYMTEMFEDLRTKMGKGKGKGAGKGDGDGPAPGATTKQLYAAFKEAKPRLVIKPSGEMMCLNAAQEVFLEIIKENTGMMPGMMPFDFAVELLGPSMLDGEFQKQIGSTTQCAVMMEAFKTMPASPAEKPEDIMKELVDFVKGHPEIVLSRKA